MKWKGSCFQWCTCNFKFYLHVIPLVNEFQWLYCWKVTFISKPETQTQTRVLGQDPDPNPGFQFLGFLHSLHGTSQIFSRTEQTFVSARSFGVTFFKLRFGSKWPFWLWKGTLTKPKGTFFLQNEAQEMTPKLLALAKVCSVLGNIRDVSWHLSKRGSELEKKVPIFHFGQKCCAQK